MDRRKLREVSGSFIIGLLWEGLITLDIILTADRTFIAVFFTSVTLSVIPFAFWRHIQFEPGTTQNRKIWGMALGSGVGATISTWLMR